MSNRRGNRSRSRSRSRGSRDPEAGYAEDDRYYESSPVHLSYPPPESPSRMNQLMLAPKQKKGHMLTRLPREYSDDETTDSEYSESSADNNLRGSRTARPPPPPSPTTTSLLHPSRLIPLLLLLGCAACAPLLLYSSSLSTDSVVGGVSRWIPEWIPLRSQNEVTLRREPRTKLFSITLSDKLILERVTDDTARSAKKYIGRAITHANGVAVANIDQYRMVESGVGDTITLRFAPSKFAVGVSVRALIRIPFKSGKAVEAGATGVVIKVPGDTDGSVATVRVSGMAWDAMPGQVEPIDAEKMKLIPGMNVKTVARIDFASGKQIPAGSAGVITRVPGEQEGSVAEVKVDGIRWDAMPGQLEVIDEHVFTPAPPSLATEEVVRLLEYLGHDQYLPKLVSYGVDRLDFLALATRKDGEKMGIKPMHWQRIINEARRRVPVSGRGREGLEKLCQELGERELVPKLVHYGLDRLDYVAQASPADGVNLGVNPNRWRKLVEEARKRLKAPALSESSDPTNEAQASVHRMLADIGMTRHYQRIVVFGLDDITRLAKAPNISATINMDPKDWKAIQSEASRRLSGGGARPVDPEVEKVQLQAQHEELARRFESEDTAEQLPNNDPGKGPDQGEPGKPSPPQQKATPSPARSAVEGIVSGVGKAEEVAQQRWNRIAEIIQKMGKDGALLLQAAGVGMEARSDGHRPP